MLKIKDSTDLKELEKYGFRYNPDVYEKWSCVLLDTFGGTVKIRITNNRIVYPVSDLDFYNLGCRAEFEMHDIIYDLIKADLVEKVED